MQVAQNQTVENSEAISGSEANQEEDTNMEVQLIPEEDQKPKDVKIKELYS